VSASLDLALAIVAAVIAIAVGALAIVRLRRRRRAAIIAVVEPLVGVDARPGERERGPPLPVVLVHGLFGFDSIGVAGVKLEYFRGIAAHLATLGCHAHAVRLPPSRSVPERARTLVELIGKLPHDRIDLVAHSLGGLDARYALAHLGLASRVRSLVTVGTPHRGSPLANLTDAGPLAVARRTIARLGISLDALDWLSTSELATFNRDIPDVAGVRYASVVGGIRDARTPVPLPIAASHAYLRRAGGANDGLVPMSSQYWGETLAEIEADHFAQIGWRLSPRGTFDAAGLYGFVVARLGDAPVAVEPAVVEERRAEAG
jgi:triacylglycerol lipase